jgi:hypothetical protein
LVLDVDGRSADSFCFNDLSRCENTSTSLIEGHTACHADMHRFRDAEDGGPDPAQEDHEQQQLRLHTRLRCLVKRQLALLEKEQREARTVDEPTPPPHSGLVRI